MKAFKVLDNGELLLKCDSMPAAEIFIADCKREDIAENDAAFHSYTIAEPLPVAQPICLWYEGGM